LAFGPKILRRISDVGGNSSEDNKFSIASAHAALVFLLIFPRGPKMILKDRRSFWLPLAVSSAGSVVLSELFAFSLIYTFVGLGDETTISARTVMKIGLTCSFVIPAIVAPLMSYFPWRVLGRMERERREMQRAAVTDPLTGLLNRRGFEVASSDALTRAARDGESVVAWHIDIDNFKRVNDVHGHALGDLALLHVAECLRNFADESGAIVARFGGDEFAALQFDVTPPAAAKAAQALCGAVAVQGRARASITISIGVAGAANSAGDFAGVLERADRALYAAKRSGRNCVVVDDPPPDAAAASFARSA
jgi:diguanylate cyclase (GGDEF)-like protein